MEMVALERPLVRVKDKETSACAHDFFIFCLLVLSEMHTHFISSSLRLSMSQDEQMCECALRDTYMKAD